MKEPEDRSTRVHRVKTGYDRRGRRRRWSKEKQGTVSGVSEKSRSKNGREKGGVKEGGFLERCLMATGLKRMEE